MVDKKKIPSTGSTRSQASGSTRTTGKASEQTKGRSNVSGTSMGKTGAPQGAVTHQPGEKKSEEAGMKQTSAMLHNKKGK